LPPTFAPSAMTKPTLAPEPTVWAEFVIMLGSHDAPTIHARLSTDQGLEMLSAVLDEAGSLEAAKESFKREMVRWVRRV
jgi:hypothetical protein